MNPTTKEKIEDLIASASNLAYPENHEFSQALRKIVDALTLDDDETLAKLVQAILKV